MPKIHNTFNTFVSWIIFGSFKVIGLIVIDASKPIIARIIGKPTYFLKRLFLVFKRSLCVKGLTKLIVVIIITVIKPAQIDSSKTAASGESSINIRIDTKILVAARDIAQRVASINNCHQSK